MEPHEAYRRGPRSAAPRRKAAGQDRDATGCDQAHARVGPLILPRTDCRLYYRLISKAVEVVADWVKAVVSRAPFDYLPDDCFADRDEASSLQPFLRGGYIVIAQRSGIFSAVNPTRRAAKNYSSQLHFVECQEVLKLRRLAQRGHDIGEV